MAASSSSAAALLGLSLHPPGLLGSAATATTGSSSTGAAAATAAAASGSLLSAASPLLADSWTSIWSGGMVAAEPALPSAASGAVPADGMLYGGAPPSAQLAQRLLDSHAQSAQGLHPAVQATLQAARRAAGGALPHERVAAQPSPQVLLSALEQIQLEPATAALPRLPKNSSWPTARGPSKERAQPAAAHIGPPQSQPLPTPPQPAPQTSLPSMPPAVGVPPAPAAGKNLLNALMMSRSSSTASDTVQPAAAAALGSQAATANASGKTTPASHLEPSQESWTASGTADPEPIGTRPKAAAASSAAKLAASAAASATQPSSTAASVTTNPKPMTAAAAAAKPAPGKPAPSARSAAKTATASPPTSRNAKPLPPTTVSMKAPLPATLAVKQPLSATAAGKEPAAGGGGAASAKPLAPVVPPAVLKTIAHGETDYNPSDFDLRPRPARFFVIKSFTGEDVHKSIKYNIWTSTESGNKRLNQAFLEKEKGAPLYLLFSVNGSGQFCGVAEMKSLCDTSKISGVWSAEKWKGELQVRWIFVKDVPNSLFRHIRLRNNENKPVTNSRDTQEVPPHQGWETLAIIAKHRSSSSIFDLFEDYEKKEQQRKEKTNSSNR